MIKVEAPGCKAKHALKLYNLINSYLFEEQCGELEKYGNASNIKALQSASKALGLIVQRSSK